MKDIVKNMSNVTIIFSSFEVAIKFQGEYENKTIN